MYAKRMSKFEGSGIRKMFELAASMKNPINLSLGQADFDVPDPVKQAAIKAIEAGHNRYSVTAGIPEFQTAIKEALSTEGVEAESTMAVAGACGGLLLALLVLADDDAEVLVPDPYFVAYGSLIELAESKANWIDTYPDFKLTPEKLKASVTPKTKVLLFNSPVNPTGIAYTAEEIEALAKTAKELGLKVISDEVYDSFCFDFPHVSWLKYDPSAILVRSFSKTGGMPGWRSGYVAGPEDIIDRMKILQQFTYVCVNTPSQWACIEAFKTDISKHIAEYREKRDIVYEGLSKAYKLPKPQGAFYVFPEIPDGDAEGFMKRCVEKELLIVPGSAFSQRNTHFRVSYAVDNDTLKKGIDLLCEIA